MRGAPLERRGCRGRGTDRLWQLYRKIGALRSAATFATWMFRIIERECYRLFRGRSRLQALYDSLDRMLQQDPLPVELRKDLTAAIAALPIYREVLILRDVDQLTAPEAADNLKISIDAVKSRLHRARQMMREHLLASGYLAVEPKKNRHRKLEPPGSGGVGGSFSLATDPANDHLNCSRSSRLGIICLRFCSTANK